MKKHTHLALVAMLALINVSAAAPDYALAWFGVNPGNRMTGEEYALSSSSGLPATNRCTGGDYAILGGYLGGTIESIYSLHLPTISCSVAVPIEVSSTGETVYGKRPEWEPYNYYLPAVVNQ